MHYETNFLTKALARLDFSSNPIGVVSSTSEISAAIRGTFPIANERPINIFQVTVGPTGAGINQQLSTNAVQVEHTKIPNGTVQAVVAPNFLTLEYGAGDYTSFDAFEADFAVIFRAFREFYPTCRIDRMGLRYINEITGPGAPMDWDGMISTALLTGTKAGLIANTRIARSMHQSFLVRGEDRAAFHYGIWNQDFPAPVVRKSFVVDIDGYRESLEPGSEVMQAFRSLNAFATDLFEESIGDDLRDKMGIVNG